MTRQGRAFRLFLPQPGRRSDAELVTMNQAVIGRHKRRMLSGPLEWVVWISVAAIGAVAFALVAGLRGDGGSVNAISMIVAALCSYAFGYRFYSKWIARRVLELNDTRATPAEKLSNGHDFDPTNRLVLLGHHFAGIAGAGPLVGPVLAAQFGFLPGTLWIIVGAVFAGAVQDFVVLFASMRRNGKSLGQIA
jgi:carbon starvation protein